MSIKLHINGDEAEFDGPLTLQELVESLGLAERRLAIELNGSIVRRAAFAEQRLEHGDRLEIVHAIGGGQEAGPKQGAAAGRGNSSLRESGTA